MVHNYTGKTKLEMITEIMNACKWSPTSTEKNIKRANNRNTLEQVLLQYNNFLHNRENALFFATILCA